MMLLSYTIVDFFNNNNGAEMQICALLTRIQCKISDAQVTVKACGPLVFYVMKLCILTPIYRYAIYFLFQISQFVDNFPNSKGLGPRPKVLKKNTVRDKSLLFRKQL